MSGWGCRECGKANGEGMAFCGFCGIRAIPLEPATETAPDPWSCRECGGANPEGTAYCGNCGARWGAMRSDDLRMVTALFADISGFTTLADTLEVEELHDIINPLIAGLAQIAERYEGFISKYAGDALLVLFGAPVAHEDDAQRALLAALEMHAALPGLLASIGDRASHLTIHVGVNTGRVVAGRVGSEHSADYSVLGDSVILAQRLESVCPSGQTYVGATTYQLCAEEFDFEPVGELQLKGKLKPVEGFRLIGRRRPGSSVERRLVGRTNEMAVLDGVLDDAAASRSVVAAVCGEPGNGKSRLLAETRVRATARGMRWLPARCLSYGATLPYWPFADLLRQALGLHIEDRPEVTVARLTEALPEGTLVGAQRLLGLPVPEAGPEQARREIHDALARWLGVLAESSSVVLSVEDTHWADRATSDAIGELARTMRDRPVAFVLSSRPEGAPALDALTADVESRHVEVRPLDTDAVVELAADVLGEPVTVDLGGVLAARTLGNPLFLEELARSLAETDVLVPTSAGLDLRPGFDLDSVPATIERVFAARVDRLPPAAAELLQLCSVIGRTTRLSLLQAVAGDPDLPGGLNLLLSEGFLDSVVDTDEQAVTFHHALLHDVAYGRLLRKHRRRLHRQVADVSRVLYGDSDLTVDLLARHLYLAEAGEEAVDPLLRAGRRAARLFANDAAALHLERAVEVLEQVPDRSRLVDALLELAAVQELRGAYDEALLLFERARELAPDQPTAWSGGAAVLRKLGRYSDALSLLDQPVPPLTTALLLERARSAFLSGAPARALTEVRAALASASDDEERADALLELVSIECEVDHPEFALPHGGRALALVERSGNVRGQAQAHRLMGDAHRRLKLLPDAARHLQRAFALAEQLGDIEEAGGALVNLAQVHFDSGDPAEAEAVTRVAAQRFERVGHGSGRAICYGNLADYLLGKGDPHAARPWAERSLSVSLSIGHRRQAAVARLTLAEIDVASGDPLQALERLREVRPVFEELAATDLVQYCDDVAAEAHRAAREDAVTPGPPVLTT